jgi:hypothetical protein
MLLLVCAFSAVVRFSAEGTALPHRQSKSTLPSGLQVDWQPCPALGVSTTPSFSWEVPPCTTGVDAMQTHRRIRVLYDADSVVWDSGFKADTRSVAVRYGGPALLLGRAYRWTVQVMTQNCTSQPSDEAVFITAAGAV